MIKRRRGIAALAAVLLSAGLGLGLGAQPAHALTLYGLCNLDANPVYSICARESQGGFSAWSRDISGDPAQQMARAYQGQVSSTACWPFTCGNGFNAAYNGASVWKIENIHTGDCMAPALSNTNEVFATPCSANGTNWVWDGRDSTSAHLVNVYQTDLVSSSRILTWNGNFSPLFTAATFQTWGMVPVIG